MALRFNGRDAGVMIQILSDLFDNSRHAVTRLELGDTYGQTSACLVERCALSHLWRRIHTGPQGNLAAGPGPD